METNCWIGFVTGHVFAFHDDFFFVLTETFCIHAYVVILKTILEFVIK